jgi:hypothetical protein
MGARRSLAGAVLGIVCLATATRSGASTVVEPIARLSLEGGYDSNAMYDGAGGDSVQRISPDLGLRARDHLWDLTLQYGGDWVRYQDRAPNGFWNQRGALTLEARPTPLLGLQADARAAYAYDPVGLALIGVFKAGQEAAFFGAARFRAIQRLTERFHLGLSQAERFVRFASGEGAAMHATTAEGVWNAAPRLEIGGDYRLSIFQEFLPATPNQISFAHGIHATAAYALTPHLRAEAFAGPALWHGPGSDGIVPEGRIALAGKPLEEADFHVAVFHGLGIGTTAAPSLVTALEAGGAWHFGRSFLVSGDGGLWHSGMAPGGAYATLAWAAAAEAAYLFDRGVKLGLAATYLARIDDPSPELRRMTIALKLGWELDGRNGR